MKKIILCFLFFMIFMNYCFALTLDEANTYIGNFCYVRYLKYEQSDIELYTTNIGKVLDVVYDNGYKIILLDYKAEIYYIRIDKIKQIKVLR